MPEACPKCGGDVVELGVTQQYQTEIPRQPLLRQFNVHLGQCRCCGQALQGRHVSANPMPAGARRQQIGPDGQAAIVYLNKHAGLAHGKIAQLFQTLFGITLSRGACAQIVLRAGERLRPAYREIEHRLRKAAVITPDETGWRIRGQTVWLHAWVGDDSVTCYHIDPQRSADSLERLLGSGWSGIFVHDGWSSYDRFADAAHQQCQAHVLRRARELEQDASGRAKAFPRQVIGLFQESLRLRDRFWQQPPTDARRERIYESFCERLHNLVARPRARAPWATAKHLDNHPGSWFLFLIDPTIPATNYRGEQAIRPAVVNRKVWGGNRTLAGAHAQAITMSVLQTCKQQALDSLSFVSQTLRRLATCLFPPLQLAAEREQLIVGVPLPSLLLPGGKLGGIPKSF